MYYKISIRVTHSDGIVTTHDMYGHSLAPAMLLGAWAQLECAWAAGEHVEREPLCWVLDAIYRAELGE